MISLAIQAIHAKLDDLVLAYIKVMLYCSRVDQKRTGIRKC